MPPFRGRRTQRDNGYGRLDGTQIIRLQYSGSREHSSVDGRSFQSYPLRPPLGELRGVSRPFSVRTLLIPTVDFVLYYSLLQHENEFLLRLMSYVLVIRLCTPSESSHVHESKFTCVFELKTVKTSIKIRGLGSCHGPFIIVELCTNCLPKINYHVP